MEARDLLQYVNYLLKEIGQSWKLAEMVEEEHNIAVRELNLFSDQLVTERASADMMEASLVVMFACLNKSTMECMELRRLLVEA